MRGFGFGLNKRTIIGFYNKSKSWVVTVFNLAKAYVDRVTTDSGTVEDITEVKSYWEMAEKNDMAESIEFCWFGQAATKQRKDGIYSYATKLYDIYNFNDATQTTPASQPLFKNVTYALDNSFSPIKKSAIYSTSREFLNIPSITVNGTLTIVDKKGSDEKPTAKHYDIDSTITTIEFTGDLFAYIIHGNTLTAAQKQAETDFFNHLYYSYTYTDVMKFTVDAGLFDFSYNNPNRLWVFPDGTTSTAERPAKTLASAGDVYLYSSDYEGSYSLNDNSTNARFTGDLSDLHGKITYWLFLNNCTNITGDLSDLQGKITHTLGLAYCRNITGDLLDLQGEITNTLDLAGCKNITGDLLDLQGRITNYLSLHNCTNVTGNLSDLQGKITNYLSLRNCTNVTGDLSDLQGKITNYLSLENCRNITGVYTPSGTALPTQTHLDNTNISSTDMDTTLINYAAQAIAINKQNGTFRANGMTRTVASDAAISTLTGLGWTVSGLTKI